MFLVVVHGNTIGAECECSCPIQPRTFIHVSCRTQRLSQFQLSMLITLAWTGPSEDSDVRNGSLTPLTPDNIAKPMVPLPPPPPHPTPEQQGTEGTQQEMHTAWA